jgi:hypothetical protein
VGESFAHPSESRAQYISHDCLFACTERVDEADAWPMQNLQDILHDFHGSEVFATLDFGKAIGRYLCTNIHKTVNLSSRRMECTHRHVYYMFSAARTNLVVVVMLTISVVG